MARGLRHKNQVALWYSHHGNAVLMPIPRRFRESLDERIASRIYTYLVRTLHEVHENFRCDLQTEGYA